MEDDRADAPIYDRLSCFDLLPSGDDELREVIIAPLEYSRGGEEASAYLVEYDPVQNRFDMDYRKLGIDCYLSAISCAPTSRDKGAVLAYGRDKDGVGNFGVWRLPKNGEENTLHKMYALPHYGEVVGERNDRGAVCWESLYSDSIEEGTRRFEETAGPGDGSVRSLLTVSGKYKTAKVWKHATSEARLLCSVDLSKELEKDWAVLDGIVCTFSPLQQELAAVALRDCICCIDPRMGKVVVQIAPATLSGSVRALSFSPHRQSLLASGGDDGVVQLWDIRNAAEPRTLTSLGRGVGPSTGEDDCHDYEITSLNFHPTYEQLISTSSADGSVRVWHLPEAAFEPPEEFDDVSVITSVWGSMVPQDMNKSAASLTHDDTIIGARWSQKDSFSLISLSYDVGLFASAVPRQFKLKVLS
mmetsp:Transcript_13043/g.34200  ORF Transcript_13043/g.34200 Transcript_13043/m.34200 type:complete len:415 (-) Transcript_13043:583-1827(-)